MYMYFYVHVHAQYGPNIFVIFHGKLRSLAASRVDDNVLYVGYI